MLADPRVGKSRLGSEFLTRNCRRAVALAACANPLLNARDVTAEVSVFSPDAECATPGVVGRGQQGVASFSHAWEAFPEARVTCERAVVEGSVAVTEGTFTGTHVGALHLPVAAILSTGRRLASRFAAMYEVRDGLIVSRCLYFDHLAILVQLGVAPALADS